MISEEDVYKIGCIGKPHGVNGEITLHFTDDIFDRAESDCLVLMIDGILVPFFIEEYRFRSEETALMKFEDVDSKDRAAELTGCDVYFPRQDADSEGNDITSWQELVGFRIVDKSAGTTVATIARVDDTTANILFEAEDDTLIPAAAELIEKVDRRKREIIMIIPEGLMTLNNPTERPR